MRRLCVAACGALTLWVSPLMAGEREFIQSTGNAYQYRSHYELKSIVYAPSVTVAGGRYVVVPEGMCTNDRERILDWAAKTTGYGAVASPKLPDGVEPDCNILNPNLRGGFADGFATQEGAERTALARCEATRLDGYEKCILVARVADGR
ncbi:hypothetical protein [Donghicola eburneus]|uniref:Putative secreted protein n=1 Tax=Donghicola eburneus TaxID=393278 RepID=A0A1M4N2N9_9RHOB|nr:hypothetical protein [Donghicola eburneus]MCI5039542.1 hypothetical protein [Donghicola eburneus]SCM69160.1 putative secreted protein [Donghicola eburneus]SFQ34946.1 hypothetical protein SAMN05421764_10361 [Donghicola eburneus]